MAPDGGNPNRISRGAVSIATVIMLLPGSFFLAKGAVEVLDRFAPRTSREATITSTRLGETFANRRTIPVYEVSGSTADGQHFRLDDRRVFELAHGSTPLAVRVDRSTLTDRIVGLRAGTTSITGVGGATGPWLALLALGMGAALSAVAFRLPWQTEARRQARHDGANLPGPDLGAAALMGAVAVAVVVATVSWDLLR